MTLGSKMGLYGEMLLSVSRDKIVVECPQEAQHEILEIDR